MATDGIDGGVELIKLMIEYGADLEAQVCISADESHAQEADHCVKTEPGELSQCTFMVVLDVLKTILTPKDYSDVQALIAKYSASDAVENLRHARRMRAEATIMELESAHEWKLLGRLYECNEADANFSFVWNRLIAKGKIEDPDRNTAFLDACRDVVDDRLRYPARLR